MESKVLANKYIIHGLVGMGGMAVVYKATSIRSGKEIAVKMLKEEYLTDADFVKRFQRESEISAKFSHKNFVNTIDVGIWDGKPYIAMEYVEGRTLKDIIKTQGALSLDMAVNISLQACDALAYAHKNGLVHRDIKPQNILVRTDNQTIKIADFGIAHTTTSSTITQQGDSMIIGSVHYLSPEQASGAYTDFKTDIYSLGIVLYEMLTGEVPFDGESPVAIAIKHMQEEPTSPTILREGLPVSLERIVFKAICKDKAERYRDIAAMRADLFRALTEPDGDYIEDVRSQVTDNTTEMAKVSHTEDTMTDSKRYRSVNRRNAARAKEKKGTQAAEVKRAPSTYLRVFRVFIIVCVVIGLFVTTYLSILMRFNENFNSEKILVTDVCNMSATEATNVLARSGIKSYTLEQYDTSIPAGEVISQDPAPDSYLQRGSMVKLIVSLGPKVVKVPNVVNKSFIDAARELEDAGLAIGDVELVESNTLADTVIQQDPTYQDMLNLGDKVNLWITKPTDSTKVNMPDMSSWSLNNARSYLSGLGIKQLDIHYMVSEYPEGLIIQQEPAVGEVISEDSNIEFWVSSGSEAIYYEEKEILAVIKEKETSVKVIFEDDNQEQVVYDEVLSVGTQTIILALTSKTQGNKTLIIYYDGVEQFRDQVLFDGQ